MNLALLQQVINRPEDVHKYNFGHVLVIGGSPGMVGAPLLCGKAALRVGAGLVTIASDEQTVDKLERRVEEIMTFSLPESRVNAGDTMLDFINEKRISAMVIGPGLGTDMSEMVRQLAPRLTIPIVLDAGGLLAFTTHLTLLQQIARKNPHIIVTPHAGEYARLSGSPASELEELRSQAVQFAKNYRLTVVLKGSHTIVARSDGSHEENPTGNPGLATAGTGDVLAGMIAGLLAQGIAPGDAAELAVYVHGLAGDLAAADKTQAGMIASDVIEYIPRALMQASQM